MLTLITQQNKILNFVRESEREKSPSNSHSQRIIVELNQSNECPHKATHTHARAKDLKAQGRSHTFEWF